MKTELVIGNIFLFWKFCVVCRSTVEWDMELHLDAISSPTNKLLMAGIYSL